jgi:phage N-6-adenine-methyltransferase
VTIPDELHRALALAASGKMAVHFSSKTDQHATPQDFFDRLNARYGPFELDVCADASNTKCSLFFSEGGLEKPWLGESGRRIWMNPPYGREIGRWVAKASEVGATGGIVCCLLPARTDTVWWHTNVMPVIQGARRGEVLFVRGRLTFGNATASAPFPSAVVVFGISGTERWHVGAIEARL